MWAEGNKIFEDPVTGSFVPILADHFHPKEKLTISGVVEGVKIKGSYNGFLVNETRLFCTN